MVRGPREDETCRRYVIPLLEAAGWSAEDEGDHFYVGQVAITAGQIVKVGTRHRRNKVLAADYVLYYASGVPVAVVEAKRLYRFASDGMQQAKRYAALLDVPFSYSTNGQEVVESDQTTGRETPGLTRFPTPDELWSRYREWKGIVDDTSADGLLLPFAREVRTPSGDIKVPRYYQQVAINRAVESILGGRKRLLLTMATGTGKTFVSLQIVWKLWSSAWRAGRKPRILYLADRNILLKQPMDEYQPVFAKGADTPIWKLGGTAQRGREIYFALYQAIADSGSDPNGVFREFPSDFFDLVIVDECHRGSANAASAWRSILDYFSTAAQLGMTATPKHDETADTYRYFGNPLYQYSLAQGIADGFLAPYRVRRVVLSPDAYGWAPDDGQLDRFGREIPDKLYKTKHFERVVSLLTRTDAAARYLTDYLHRTNRWDKTIVFCVDQDHADQMRQALHNANADLTRDDPDYVARITSDEGSVGKTLLGQFADTQSNSPIIATTSLLLSTGVDLPTVKNVVLFRPIGSLSLFKQMIGRGTRVFEDAGKMSFDIIDFAGATRLFNDPDFDGPPEHVDEEEIDGSGDVVQAKVVEEPEPAFGTEEPDGSAAGEAVDPTNGGRHVPAAPVLNPGDGDALIGRKYYVDDGEVVITAEAIYHIDPDTGAPRLVEYRDHVTKVVRTLFLGPEDLRTRWSTASGRQEARDLLEARGIDDDELLERLELTDLDPFDVLVHLAWGQPRRTRYERARRLRHDHAAFLDRYQPAARAVLDHLLDKYAEHGIAELDDPGVFRMRPLSDLGSAREIAERFGSARLMRQAVEELGSLLYAA